jgi:hypothetical protein
LVEKLLQLTDGGLVVRSGLMPDDGELVGSDSDEGVDPMIQALQVKVEALGLQQLQQGDAQQKHNERMEQNQQEEMKFQRLYLALDHSELGSFICHDGAAPRSSSHFVRTVLEASMRCEACFIPTKWVTGRANRLHQPCACIVRVRGAWRVCVCVPKVSLAACRAATTATGRPRGARHSTSAAARSSVTR